jgi:hypothetical protein
MTFGAVYMDVKSMAVYGDRCQQREFMMVTDKFYGIMEGLVKYAVFHITIS